MMKITAIKLAIGTLLIGGGVAFAAVESPEPASNPSVTVQHDPQDQPADSGPADSAPTPDATNTPASDSSATSPDGQPSAPATQPADSQPAPPAPVTLVRSEYRVVTTGTPRQPDYNREQWRDDYYSDSHKESVDLGSCGGNTATSTCISN